MIKTSTNQAAAMMLKMVSNLPAVKQLIEQERKNDKDESTKARAECIGRLKTLRIKERDAATKFDAAKEQFEVAESKLLRLKEGLHIAGRATTDANRERNNAEQELMAKHGEGYVIKGLGLLAQLREKVLCEIEDKEHLRYINWVVNSMVVSRRENPEYESMVSASRERLAEVEKHYADALKLIECDMDPSDIQERIDALLIAAGCKPKSQTIEAEEIAA